MDDQSGSQSLDQTHVCLLPVELKLFAAMTIKASVHRMEWQDRKEHPCYPSRQTAPHLVWKTQSFHEVFHFILNLAALADRFGSRAPGPQDALRQDISKGPARLQLSLDLIHQPKLLVKLFDEIVRLLSRAGLRMLMPALFTRMSILPNRARAASTDSVTWSWQRHVPRHRHRPAPFARISSSAASTSAPVRARQLASAPASARPRASARPIPRPAPVPRATRQREQLHRLFLPYLHGSSTDCSPKPPGFTCPHGGLPSPWPKASPNGRSFPCPDPGLPAGRERTGAFGHVLYLQQDYDTITRIR